MHEGRFTGRTLAQRLSAPAQLRLPSPHLGLSWRNLRQADLDEVRDLLDESSDARAIDEFRILRSIGALLDGTAGESTDALGGWDPAGTLQAIGLVNLNSNPLTEVHADVLGLTRPQWRGRGIGRALLEWQDGRARQLILQANHDLPASIRSRVRSDNLGRRRLLAAGGFSPQWRWTFMDLELAESHRELAMHATQRLAARGMFLEVFEDSHSEEVRRLHNRVSMVMERRQPLSTEQWRSRLAGSNLKTSSILTDGTNIVGYLLSASVTEGDCLYVTFYGIDRGFRNQGNGTDLILSHIDRALDRGFTRLSVPIVSEGALETNFLKKYGFFEADSQILYTIDI